MNETAQQVPLDAAWLDEVLARIEDLAELKVVLHVWRVLASGGAATVRLEELLVPAVVRSVAGPTSPEPGPERVRRAIDRALANGWLLRLTAYSEDEQSALLLPATAANRELLERVRLGDPAAERTLALPPSADVSLHRPNVFALYERHIGPLTPLVAEQLRDVEEAYPRAWIEQAIDVAVDYNKRNWRYVESILRRWEEIGGPDGIAQRHP